MKLRRLTPAFSMLELVFVIAILGIVASIGAEMIAKVYEGYIVQRAEHKATMKTELAATQIANRLSSAIPGTVIRRLTKTGAFEEVTDDMLLDPTGNTYTVLQWVGSDTDSFAATNPPGWSGFVDISDPTNTANQLSTPGSALGTTTTIINNLSAGAPEPKIYFPYDLNEYNASIAGTTITFSGAGATHVVEHYKLAWSSYALVVEDGGLYLYHDFPAIPATGLGNATRSLLLSNVNTFKFKGEGRTIRFKICKEERISEDLNVSACKEKAVF
jgi:prepilin-type N-terminal cleavage/methylation domain-containing protein